MNIYVVTENNFFFIGLETRLHLENMVMKKIHPNDLERKSMNKFHHDDVFIFHTSFFGVELSFLISTGGLPGKFIFIPTSSRERFKLVFNRYSFLDTYATVEEITDRIININKHSNLKYKFINNPLTNREITVIHHTIKGMDADEIGQCLCIATKTVYAHRRNAFKKLGGRSLFDIWPFRGAILHASMV